MRTFLSHDATARCSLTGEKAKSDTLSSGGELRATSFEMSPVVLVWAVAVDELTVLKRAILPTDGYCINAESRFHWQTIGAESQPCHTANIFCFLLICRHSNFIISIVVAC